MNKSDLKHSLSLFGQDNTGCFITSPLFDLEINLQVNGNNQYRDVAQAIRNLQHDLWQVSAITSRLVWMRDMRREGHLEDSSWCRYCHLDVENYFVQIRSVMDYLATVIARYGNRKGQIPESFASLRNYARKNPERLEPEICDLVLKADWFDELRTIRDGLVHKGNQPMVFPDKDDWLLFQIHGNGLKNMISTPFMLYNENVAYFQRSAAWFFANTLSTLDQVGAYISPKFQHELNIGESRSYDFTLLSGWINDLLDQLGSSP